MCLCLFEGSVQSTGRCVKSAGKATVPLVTPQAVPKVAKQQVDADKRLERLRRAFSHLKQRQEQLDKGFKLDVSTFAIVGGAVNIPSNRGFIFDDHRSDSSASESTDSPRSSNSNSAQNSPASKTKLSATAQTFNPLFTCTAQSPRMHNDTSSSGDTEEEQADDERADSNDTSFDGQFDNQQFNNNVFYNQLEDDYHNYYEDYTGSPYSEQNALSPISCDSIPSFPMANPFTLPLTRPGAGANSIRVVSDIEASEKAEAGKKSSKVRILPPDDPNVNPMAGPFYCGGPIASALAMTQGGLLSTPIVGKPKFTISILNQEATPDPTIFG